MKLKLPISLLAALLFSAGSQPSTCFAQGGLTPPGPPGPTFKTLSQVEPRTPVSATTTPGNFLAHFIINQSGSYYLTTNLVGESGKRGIQIEAGHVILDLNGFSLVGHSNGLDGIYFPSAATTNFTLRNGIVRGWTGGSGIYFSGVNGTFEHLNVSANNQGIRCGSGSQIRGCTFNDNLRSGMVVAGAGCLILENNCAGNNTLNDSSSAGIVVSGSGNRIEGNHVRWSGAANAGYGIYVGGTANLLIRNSVISEGTNNYSVGAGNMEGPRITNTGTITNANPWANFSF